MERRIAYICSMLSPARVFADIGCDHGYMTEYMLKKGLCERAYISDVSAKSLKKAEKLLARFIAAGKCFPVVADGMRGLREECDLVLIAGLGGEEIVKILQEAYLPARFLLQPMHNSDKLRRYLSERGAKLERDHTFAADGYYYDLICGSATGGGRDYTESEIFFGRENLVCPTADFFGKWEKEAEKLKDYLARKDVSEKNREILGARFERIVAQMEKLR